MITYTRPGDVVLVLDAHDFEVVRRGLQLLVDQTHDASRVKAAQRRAAVMIDEWRGKG